MTDYKGLRGFGTKFECGTVRNWYIDSEGVKRWADNNEPCDTAIAGAAGEKDCG